MQQLNGNAAYLWSLQTQINAAVDGRSLTRNIVVYTDDQTLLKAARFFEGQMSTFVRCKTSGQIQYPKAAAASSGGLHMKPNCGLPGPSCACYLTSARPHQSMRAAAATSLTNPRSSKSCESCETAKA